MPDINLLPEELRAKEKKERKGVVKTPKVIEFKMSSPLKEGPRKKGKVPFVLGLFKRRKKLEEEAEPEESIRIPLPGEKLEPRKEIRKFHIPSLKKEVKPVKFKKVKETAIPEKKLEVTEELPMKTIAEKVAYKEPSLPEKPEVKKVITKEPEIVGVAKVPPLLKKKFGLANWFKSFFSSFRNLFSKREKKPKEPKVKPPPEPVVPVRPIRIEFKEEKPLPKEAVEPEKALKVEEVPVAKVEEIELPEEVKAEPVVMKEEPLEVEPEEKKVIKRKEDKRKEKEKEIKEELQKEEKVSEKKKKVKKKRKKEVSISISEHIPEEPPVQILDINLIPEGLARRFELNLAKRVYILITSVVLSCLAIVVVSQLIKLYQTKIGDEIQEAEQRIKIISEKIDDYEKIRMEADGLRLHIIAVEELLGKHLYWTKIFEKLEEYTIDDVYYLDFAASEHGSIILSAAGKDYKSVARQLKAFQEAYDFVSSVNINNATANIHRETGQIIGVNFNISLNLIPDIYYIKFKSF